jgi:hypothetical protein
MLRRFLPCRRGLRIYDQRTLTRDDVRRIHGLT